MGSPQPFWPITHWPLGWHKTLTASAWLLGEKFCVFLQ